MRPPLMATIASMGRGISIHSMPSDLPASSAARPKIMNRFQPQAAAMVSFGAKSGARTSRGIIQITVPISAMDVHP